MHQLLAMAVEVSVGLGLYATGLFVVLIARNALMSRHAPSGSIARLA